METHSFKENLIRQIPALQMLVNLGYTYPINQNLHNKVVGFIVLKQQYKYGI